MNSLLTPYQSDGKYVKVDTYFFELVLSPLYDKVAVFIPGIITPNQITVFGGMLCLTSAYLFSIGQFTAASLVYIGYCTADNLDGKHARATKQCSDWGGILDHCVDGSCSTPAGDITTTSFVSRMCSRTGGEGGSSTLMGCSVAPPPFTISVPSMR